MIRSVLIVAIFFTTPLQLHSETLEIFGGGSKQTINTATCTNIQREFSRRVSYFNLSKGGCARFYEDRDCNHESIEVRPGSSYQQDLRLWGFSDRAKSVGPCDKSCAPGTTQIIPQSPLQIHIYSKENLKGAYAEMIVDGGCTQFPNGFVDHVQSVDTHRKCVIVHNNDICDWTGEGADFIELVPGTTTHMDLKKWGFYRARAISQCRKECLRTLGGTEVVFYDEANFRGNWIRLFVTNCLTLPHQWEGIAQSVKIDPSSVFTLFEGKECEGRSVEVTSESLDKLPDSKVKAVRSIRLDRYANENFRPSSAVKSSRSMSIGLYSTISSLLLLCNY